MAVPLKPKNYEFQSDLMFSWIDTTDDKNQFSTFVLLPYHQRAAEFTVYVDKKPISWLWDFIGWDSKIRKLVLCLKWSQI